MGARRWRMCGFAAVVLVLAGPRPSGAQASDPSGVYRGASIYEVTNVDGSGGADFPEPDATLTIDCDGDVCTFEGGPPFIRSEPVTLTGGGGSWQFSLPKAPNNPDCGPEREISGSITIKGDELRMEAGFPFYPTVQSRSDPLKYCSEGGNNWTFTGTREVDASTEGSEPAGNSSAESAAESGGTDTDESGSGTGSGAAVAAAVTLTAAAAVAGTLILRRRRQTPGTAGAVAAAAQPQVRARPDAGHQTIAPSGPSTALEVRATADDQPRTTISRAGDGSTAH